MSGEAGAAEEVATDPTSIALERDWDILLDEIEEGEVIPVIGQEFLSEETGGQTFDAGFARKLADLLKLEVGEDTPSVASVIAEYARLGKPRGAFRDSMEWLVRHEAESLSPESPRPESLARLAQITPFRIFVTTTFDHWMEQALTAAGRKPVSLAYGSGDDRSDLPRDYEHRPEAFVYHLLGRPGDSAFAVFEDDILEFMHQLLSPASPRRPEQLFDALEKSHLLFLGCRFPDWLTRFFVRMARGMPLADPHGRRNWIAGGTVAGETGKGLEQFLKTSERTKIFTGYTAATFIAELHRRWKKRHPVGLVEESAPEPSATDKVFLSYASEDREALFELCKRLDEKKVLYWFDRSELKAGDDWNAKIRRNVRSCCLFVPLMSEHVATDRERYFRVEWAEALERQEMQPENGRFILPVLLEGAPWSLAEAPQISGDLQKLNWMNVSDFVDQIVDFYKEKQRDHLDGLAAE